VWMLQDGKPRREKKGMVYQTSLKGMVPDISELPSWSQKKIKGGHGSPLSLMLPSQARPQGCQREL